jgi:hypothetical protein
MNSRSYALANPISNRCSTTSANNGTDGSSRRNGWRHSRSRISGTNLRPRSLSRGGECSQRPQVHSCFYGLWASSVGAFCFQLFANILYAVAGHGQFPGGPEARPRAS